MRFIAFTHPNYGHVAAMRVLIREAASRGVAVTAYCGREFEKYFTGLGADLRFYRGAVVEDLSGVGFEHGTITLLLRRLWESSLEVVEAERAWIAEERPDCILHDSVAPWGKQLARLERIPSVSMSSPLIMNGAWLRLALRSGFRENRFMSAVREARPAWNAMQRFERRTGLKPLMFLGAAASYSSLSIAATSRYFQPGGDAIGPEWLFAPPPLEDFDATPFTWPEDRGGDLILVVPSTAFPSRPGYFHSALEALADIDHGVVVATGPHVSPDRLPAAAANTTVRPFIPLATLLPRARVIITNGGIGTLTKAFRAGVPSINVPVSLEQAVFAKRVEDLGAGVMILPQKLSAQRIRRAVDRILADDRYRINASRIGDSLASSAPAHDVVDAIIDFAKRKRRHPA